MSEIPSGTHKVTLSPSFLNASRTDAPDDEYVAMRYTFQPSTLDHTAPSSLSVSKGGEVILSRPSKDHGAHVFKGIEVPAKEVDCLLIYDDGSGTYRLEQMGSVVRLEHQRVSGMQPSSQSREERSDEKDGGRISRKEAASRETEAEADVRSHPSTSKPGSNSESHRMVVPPSSATFTKGEEKIKRAVKETEEEEEQDDEDLDDLAHLLESTLDESSSTTIPTSANHAAPSKRLDGRNEKDDESSEDED